MRDGAQVVAGEGGVSILGAVVVVLAVVGGLMAVVELEVHDGQEA